MRVVGLSLFSLAASQFDGNPFGWDRTRRCDHFQYDPPCGACEGVGGIVWGDNKTDYTPTNCEVVSTDIADPVRPRWTANFKVVSHEILIGKKQDPNCFQAFPWNSSIGEHCYKPQECDLRSDLGSGGKRAIYLYANQAGNLGVDGNVSSTIIHQGPNMWIINDIVNKGKRSILTICTQPAEGGDHSKPGVEPVQYNWTDNLFFIAREKIGVEYVWQTMELDHWAFGPHHAWVDPETGVIVRMWQPFNGLQVFEPGTWEEGVQDPKYWEDLSVDGSTAPKAGRKDGNISDFRIKCTDDGFYTGPSTAAASDLKRARSKVPRAEYVGSDFQDMSSQLNSWLLKHAPNSRECDEWTVDELQHLQMTILQLRDPELDEIYQSSQDNRRLRMPVELAKEWAELNTLAAQDPELARIRRDGHCHEAVMWYVHHLPEHMKSELKDKLSLPLLSYNHHSTPDASHPVLKAYEEQVTCQSCHAKVFPDDSTVV